MRPSFFFFGGLSIHLTVAVLAHLFSYNITWGATKKEVERSNFFIEVPRILKRFWLALLVSFACFGSIVVFSMQSIAGGWVIPGTDWAVVFPLALVAGCHVLFPVSPCSQRLDRGGVIFLALLPIHTPLPLVRRA